MKHLQFFKLCNISIEELVKVEMQLWLSKSEAWNRHTDVCFYFATLFQSRFLEIPV